MSTQPATSSIPFSITTPHQSFRLLELPPELLILLASEDRPATLDLKSSASTNDKSGTKPSSEYLHLCTTTKSWAVRQVSTSNSVYIINPSTSGITAISKPTSHLELLPLNPSPTEITTAITHLLPTCDNADNYHDYDNNPTPSLTKTQLLSSLPYPSYPILSTLRSLFAFPGSPHSYLHCPTPALLLTTLRLLFQHAAILEVSLSNPERNGFTDISENILMDEGSNGAGQIYFAVCQAIIDQFTDTMGQVEDGMEMTEQEREVFSTAGPLKGRELTVFTGQTIVKCAGVKGIEKGKLEEEWKGMVDDGWEKYCDMDELGSEYKIVEDDGKELVKHVPASSGIEATEASSKPAVTTGKRKWHEKFAAQREQR